MTTFAMGSRWLPWFGGRGKRHERADASGSEGLPIEQRLVVGSRTDVGCVREGNEDSFCVVRPGADRSGAFMAAVCDGMGGHAAGETASRLATAVLTTHYHRKPGDPGRSLADAVRTANRVIHEAASSDAQLAGMGTTCTAIAIHSGQAWCAHVGDSRCYLVRDGNILLMTEDHSSVMELVREGSISASEARHHPDKNVILRALGSHREVEVAVWPRPFALEPNDRLLLCSDGLYDVVTDEDILAGTADVAPQQACDSLVELARQRGAPDNVTVVVIAVPGSSDNRLSITRPVPVVR